MDENFEAETESARPLAPGNGSLQKSQSLPSSSLGTLSSLVDSVQTQNSVASTGIHEPSGHPSDPVVV